MSLAQAVIVILAGGAFGAVINLLHAAYRNRIQPVSYSLLVRRNPETNPENSHLNDVLEKVRSAQNFDVFSIDFKVRNSGNSDLEQLRLSLEFLAKTQVFHVDVYTIDSYHACVCSSPPSIDQMTSELDLVYEPFERDCEYLIRCFAIFSGVAMRTMHKVRISSPEPVRFVETFRSWRRGISFTYSPWSDPNTDMMLELLFADEEESGRNPKSLKKAQKFIRTR